MKKSTFIYNLTAYLLLGALLPGCGGGGSTNQPATSSGRFAVTIKWPARSRLIPSAANSVKLTLSGNAGVLGTVILSRPVTGTESSTVFPGLSAGPVTLSASAFPNTDATGIAQAVGTASGIVVNAKTTTITVKMDSTVVRLDVTPANTFIDLNTSQQMTATAFDVENNIVLIDPLKIKWSVSNTVDFIISDSGLCTSTGASRDNRRSSDVIATEIESGNSIKGTANVDTGECSDCG